MNKRNNTIYLVTNSLGEDHDLVSGNNPPTGTNPPTVINPVADMAPEFVGNLRQEVYSGTSAEIFWDRATDDGFIQGYEIIRNGESLGVRDALSLFEQELDPTVTYTYAVTAIDTDGNRSGTFTISLSTAGAETNADGSDNNPATETGSGPEFAANLRHQVYSDSAVEIFWDRVSNDDNVRGYEVSRNGESLGISDSSSLFEEGLDPTLTYTYVVTAIDKQGNLSAPASITLSTAGKPTTPRSLRYAVYSDTAAELFWDRSTDNGTVQGYEIGRNGESLGVRDTLSMLDEGLDPAVTNTYTVTAIDNEGNRSVTATLSFSTGNRPTTPGNLRYAVYSDTAVELFWDRATDDGFIQGYEIRRNGEWRGISDSLSVFEEDLDPAQTYTYTLTAIDNEGNRSISIRISLSSGDRPTPPGNVRHQVYSGTAAEIFWNRAIDDGSVQGYEVIRNGESLGIRDSLGMFEEGLDPATVYTYEVTTIDNEGNRSATTTITVSTAEE